MSSGRSAGVIAGALLVGVAVFQVALALGAPWGDMSYGGRAETVDGVLSSSYRVMSAVAAVVLGFSAWIVLARIRVVSGWFLGSGFLRIAAWVVFGYLVLNTLTNLASSHAGERFGLGAVTIVAAVACFVVARSPASAG